jgi:surface antigen
MPGQAGRLSFIHALPPDPSVAVSAGHGRTRRPAFNARRYRVRAGHSVRVLVIAHAVWGHPRRCSLTVAGPAYRRSFTVRGVTSNFWATFHAARQVRRGEWRLRVSCRVPGRGESAPARAGVRVSSRHTGHIALVGSSGPFIDAVQNAGPANAGYGGGAKVPPNPGFPNGQCTYFAYEMRPDIYWQSRDNGAPAYGWDAYKWAPYAAQYGHFPEGSIPSVGAVMVEPPSSRSYVGHVAYVTQVFDGSHFVTQEMNTDGQGVPDRVFTVYDYTGSPDGNAGAFRYHRDLVPGTVFIYGGPAQTPGQPPPTTTTTAPPPTTTTTTTTVSGTTTTGTTTTPPPPPQTWGETAGGVAHTWTNYTNAGGTEGPSVAGGQTVQIACRLQGFRVADGNTWWYRIAQAPWSDNYYVSADAFYNNGATSGPLTGTPFVDTNVAMC